MRSVAREKVTTKRDVRVVGPVHTVKKNARTVRPKGFLLTLRNDYRVFVMNLTLVPVVLVRMPRFRTEDSSTAQINMMVASMTSIVVRVVFISLVLGRTALRSPKMSPFIMLLMVDFRVSGSTE